ncbi:ABC transporter ATP-binding protein [Kouleothrix sp.]|uniref:ABC transporter ATP-binding protein n=1 Tax=Kouleothrix sp. TaxID=2779161 RepID=UPI00391B5DF5
MAVARREFTVADAYAYDHRTPVRWIISHVLRYPWLPIGILLGNIFNVSLYNIGSILIGRAFDIAARPGSQLSDLLWIALAVLAVRGGYGLLDLGRVSMVETLAQRLERDSREELYISLLGKSQTFHNRQQVGDIMARATNDVQQLNLMISPGAALIGESVFFVIIPLIGIATVRAELLAVPLVFLVGLVLAIRGYSRALSPVSGALRGQFGAMNARLAEAIAGIEVVKGYAQEPEERRRFTLSAGGYRDLFVQEGRIKARYLPLLLFGIAYGLSFGHALLLFMSGTITIGQVVAFMGLLSILRFPTFISLFSFSLVQLGIAGAERILALIKEEAELDENAGGSAQPIRGAIEFKSVSFGYSDERPNTKDQTASVDDAASNMETPALTLRPSSSVLTAHEEDRRPKTKDESASMSDAASNMETPALTLRPSSSVLNNISFTASPGETIAIVGQTGSGKTTLTKLVNRTYDASGGQVLIDGVDVRAWSLQSLRSQISTIEQDIFLFSRSIAENIGFGAAGSATREQIEQAAREAQAHDFIMQMPEGYDTVIGERGVTLSGGQRQRIAIARAFLTNPRILILDDSTSAIDSATEDLIQQAMRRIQQGRTTLLITHRISQIRWADRILVLRRGRLVAQGTHDELIASSEAYRRIFAHYERAKPAAPQPADHDGA